MISGTVSIAVFVLLVVSASVASEERCSQLIAPTNIQTEHTDVWKILLEYPMIKMNITYKCPKKINGNGENENTENSENPYDGKGEVIINTVVKKRNHDDSHIEKAINSKRYGMMPVPGLRVTLFLGHEIPEMKLNYGIKFDLEGFEIVAICYSETDNQENTSAELQPWTKDTPTGSNFPFTFTDQNTLRFQMSKCDTTSNDV